MNIAIIDDHSEDCKIIDKYIREYFSRFRIDSPFFIQTFESGEAFLHTFVRNFYDIIFVDYYMNSLSGIDTAHAIRRTDRTAVIIFTTASRDFAIESFKVKASGYLVKPISFEDFSELLSLLDIKKMKERQFIEIISGYDTVRIPLNNIIYCNISGHYVQIHTVSFGICRSRMTFTELSGMLKPYPDFLICYRGCIVNMNHIEHMDDLTFFMDCGEQILLNRKNHNEVLKLYYEFLFDKVRNKKL